MKASEQRLAARVLVTVCEAEGVEEPCLILVGFISVKEEGKQVKLKSYQEKGAVNPWEITKVCLLNDVGHGALLKGDAIAPGKCLNELCQWLGGGVIGVVLRGCWD